MNDLQKFVNQKFGVIRGIEIDGQAWLVGKDIADILGYNNVSKALSDHVDEEDKLNNKTLLSIGQRGGWLINESGLYSLIFGSKLPTAKQFKHWVTSEVLPSIRQHGIYATDNTIDNMINDPEFGIKVLTELKQEREEKRLLQEQIEKHKPLIRFANTIQGSNKNILVRETAKLASNYIGVDIGEKGLYIYLRKWNLLCKSHNEPTQIAYNQGILEYVERPVRQYPFTAFTSMVTPKGQIYIINRLIKEMTKRTVA